MAEAPAFDDVYREHVERVARWARRLGGPDADVDDLVQEVFLVVHRRLDRFRGEARMTTWLYRITENVVRDGRRRDRRRRWLMRLFGATPAHAPADQAAVLDARAASRLLYRLLDELPDRARNILILFDIEELSGEQVAELTGIPLTNLWVYLHRARAELKRRAERLEAPGAAPAQPLARRS